MANTIAIQRLSIKSLTLIGFSLVVFPLATALLYGASQVNQLSQQGSSAIIDVAELVKINRQLSMAMNQAQRFASQYVVLEERDLHQQFSQQKRKLITIITEDFSLYQDSELEQLRQDLLKEIDKLAFKNTANNISDKTLSAPLTKTGLVDVQQAFKHLSTISQKINFRSNELISDHAQLMKQSADNVRATMLNSLLSIPITIIIAGTFVLLIIRPLKKISREISRLEQGHFKEKICFSGSKEIKEIADALELMRARLHALELQKSSFIRHISHELKTPLAAIREGTELLYDNSVGPLNDDQQEITHILKESVSRLQNLIEDLLDFNIVLDSTSLQDAEKTNLSSVLEQSILLRKLDIQSKKLTITTELTPVSLQTNSKQLSVIIDNLLSNAIKYSPIAGIITIKTIIDHEQLLITIQDQGPGIEASFQQKVFDAFYQGVPPVDSNIKSSGLGLTIVKELLMRLNGTIELTSLSAPEHGLNIRVSFPYSPHGELNV